jgi:Type IV secretory pathway, VirD4 components
MVDKEQAQKVKFKVIKIVFCVGIVLLLIASWYATQNVAELCGYSELLGFNIAHIYLPWHYFIWCNNPELVRVIPQILEAQEKWFYLVFISLFLVGYMAQRSMTVNISHGSSEWAQAQDIDDSGLGLYKEKPEKIKLFGIIPWTRKVKTLKDSGVVVGINPYTNKIMLHDGPEHVLLMAPTRSGKGVNTIIPTGLIWRHSIFFFDVKKELWQATGAYRRKVLGQKVMKFEPLCTDGSTARWNPLAEVDFRTTREISDISTIVEIMVRPDGKKSGGDDFWPDSAAALLKGVILHLLYSHYQEGKPLPCPTDIMSFLSSPNKSTNDLFRDMKEYPHISPKEFMSDHNVLFEVYGEYIGDWRSINQQLNKWGYPPVHSILEIKAVIEEYRMKHKKDIPWQDPPWMNLLSHPKVAEAAANMLNGAEQTRASIMQTAQTALAIYQNPVVQKNTAVSDFTVRDLLNPSQAVSMYLCMEVDDVATIKPLSRLFINTILSKLIRNMKFDVNQSGKSAGDQRLLLMLDEFPQLGNMNKIEMALAVCAGYGIKMVIVTQDLNQLNKEYTKDNSISSNCHVQICFTPNLDSGGATAKAISEALGKYTISTVSHSSGSNGWFSGSDSTSSTSRDLMTPDEVSRMGPDEEIVFIAGHKPIHGKKLRYHRYSWFNDRIMPELLHSDTCTKIFSYEDLFKVHEAERLELEERISEVKDEKAHMLLDSAYNEKLRADQAVQEAKEKLEALKKDIDTEKISEGEKRRLIVAESQLVIAENASSLAKAHIDIYNASLQITNLERMISKLQMEKNASSLSETFITADMKLKQAQSEYTKAKNQLSDALKKEDRVQKVANAENQQLKARMNLMAALDQLDGTKENVKTIFREANLQNKTERSERKISAQNMLDIATAAKEAAEQEVYKAEAAYKAVLDAIKTDCKENIPSNMKNRDIEGEKSGKALTPPDDDKAEEITDFEDMEDDWEAKVWGLDPTDESEEEENIEIPYVVEDDDDEDGENNEGTGQAIVGQKGDSTTESNQYSDASDGDEQEAAFNGTRRSSEKSRAAKLAPVRLDDKSWPVIRAKQRARRQKVMELHHQQFPTE